MLDKKDCSKHGFRPFFELNTPPNIPEGMGLFLLFDPETGKLVKPDTKLNVESLYPKTHTLKNDLELSSQLHGLYDQLKENTSAAGSMIHSTGEEIHDKAITEYKAAKQRLLDKHGIELIPAILTGHSSYDNPLKVIYQGFNNCLFLINNNNHQASYEDDAGNKFTVVRSKESEASPFLYSFRVGNEVAQTTLLVTNKPSQINWTKYKNTFRFINLK